MSDDLSNKDNEQFQPIAVKGLADSDEAYHPPRVLMLNGSLRERGLKETLP